MPNGQIPDSTHPSFSETRPLFVDNRGGNTLARAIQGHLKALRDEAALPWEVSIASAFFNVQGFNLIADDLESLARVRLLLGAEPKPEAERPPRQPGDPPEQEWTRRMVGEGLEALDRGLQRERDLLPFDGEADAAVRRLLDMLHSGKVEVRRYAGGFLHAKAFIFRVAGGGTVVGSSNLTYAGLRRNLELNLGHYEDPVVGKVEEWFDELWDAAEPYDLAAIYDRLMAEYEPYLIFMRVLWELYGEELEEEAEETPGREIPVTTFQQHGVWRAMRIMRRYGGVVIADGVGLGKTFTAGEIMRQYRERRQRVLLVCPAALRDTTWRDFQDRFDLPLTCVSFEELARDQHFGGDGDALGGYVDEYQLVVIDEAHNYRNPDSPARAGVLRRLLMGPRRDLLLLTATPVNNSLWDLYHVLRYFIKQDAIFADRGVLSMRERFDEAMDEDPFDLSPDVLYPIIDATTVKRTRRFVKKHYPGDLIRQPDGTYTPVKFPRPIASSINYSLDEVLPGLCDELEEALGPESGLPLLKMARYQAGRYRFDEVEEDEAKRYAALVGLLRSALLKRFESSVFAFARTTERMIAEHDLFLNMLDRGWVVEKELLHELAGADDEGVVEEYLGASEHKEPASDYHLDRLRADVQRDRDVLDRLRARAASVRPDEDPKMTALIDELAAIAGEAEEEGFDEEDRRRKRKVLVFSSYAETIDWIEGRLDRLLDTDSRLAPYRGRLASVAGDEARRGVSRDQAVLGFAPESAGGGADRAPNDRFDILLSTDVLAEGMNLQQCRNIVNYDLPWNPMRLVQRHGRIDRINSRHERVFMRTVFPDRELDRLLNLEHRVRRKLAQAAASVGIEHTPIEQGAERDQSFADTREEIEKLARGDATIYEEGGTAAGAQSGEEYRQELRKALRDRSEEILGLPWKAGSGMVKGDRRGHFFCARVGERVYLRFVPVGTSDDKDVIDELGPCLRLVECQDSTPRVVPQDLKQTAYSAWERARRHIHGAWTYETDPANLQPRVPKLNRDLADLIRSYPPPGMEQGRIDRCLEAIEAPCSVREQNLLRRVLEGDFANNGAKAQAIVEEVERIGLEPFQPPEPLPPIREDEVHLVCWMAIEAR